MALTDLLCDLLTLCVALFFFQLLKQNHYLKFTMCDISKTCYPYLLSLSISQQPSQLQRPLLRRTIQ